MGVHPELLAELDGTDAAMARTFDRSAPEATPLELAVPADYRAGGKVRDVLATIDWWVGRMQQPDRMIEERLTWFWHDHFATSVAKVRVPYLVYQQHLMLRQHAGGNFGDLLKAVARDPAMLLYLDGITNASAERNENFGRECLELFTMGRDGGYTQDDVVAASRAFTGWVVAIPGRPNLARLGAPWSAVFLPRRHDAGAKTLLGTTGAARHGRRPRRDPGAAGDRPVRRHQAVARPGGVGTRRRDRHRARPRLPPRLRDPAVGARDRAARRVHLRRRGPRQVPLTGGEAGRHRAGVRRAPPPSEPAGRRRVPRSRCGP